MTSYSYKSLLEAIKNWNNYKEELQKRLGLGNPLIRQIKSRAKRNIKRVVFAEAENYKMLKAAEIVINEKLAHPILLGDEELINQIIQENELELEGVEIINPKSTKANKLREEFAELFWKKRQRQGVTMSSAQDVMLHRNYFSPMLVESGYADAMISGLTRNYPNTLGPALKAIGKKPGASIVSGMIFRKVFKLA